MVLTIRQFSHTWWREVCKKVKKSVVFIDNEAAESLHWNGGVTDLMTAGAIGVREFSSFESGLVSQKKAVFISSCPIFGLSEVVLRDIIKNSHFEYCILISVAHPSLQQLARGGENDMAALQNLEDDMLQWMGNMNYTVEIFYMPLFLASITESVFVTPIFKHLFPVINDAGLGETNKIQLYHVVSCLHSWFTQLDVKESIFAMGPLSEVLAGHLEDFPAAVNRRKIAVNRASLILIDRTLDLMTAVKHNSDSVLDRILDVLPQLPGHSNDVAVNMSTICHAKVVNVLDDLYLVPGCLSQPNADICPKVMEWLINKKQKEILIGLNQHILQISSEARSERGTTRVTPHSLEKQIATLRGNNDIILKNSGVVQQALAVTQTLKSPRCAQLDLLASIESLQLQDGDSALTQMIQLIRTRHERKLSLEDIFCLLIHLYSSSSEISFQEKEEIELETVIADALVQDREIGGILKLTYPDIDKSSAIGVSQQICETLQSLPSARYEFLCEGSGLLQQLLVNLFDPARPTIPELNTKSQALTELLKSGFSLLLNKTATKHPLDNSQLIIYVIGGITSREIKIIEETVANSGLSIDLLIGSTRLITPIDALQSILLSGATSP